MGLNATFANFAHYAKTFYAREFSAREAANGVVMYVGHPGGVATVQAQEEGFDNKTLVAEICTPQAWTYCQCVSNSSMLFDPSNCLLSIERGSAALAWLAAAPRSVIEAGTDSKFFALCTPLDAPSDQYRSYAQAQSEGAAAAYGRELTALWTKWTR